jgi:hypothetical protein
MAASSGNNFQGSVSFDVSQAISELQKLQDKYTQLQTAIANKSYSPAVLNSLELEAERVNKQLQSLQTTVNATGQSLENNLTAPSYNSFRAIGQMDRITREFAAGGLNQGLNGLTMFGNSLTRLAAQEGGFKNVISGLAGAFSGPAGIVLAVSAAIGIFEHFSAAQKKVDEQNEKITKGVATDVVNVEKLVAQYKSSNTTLEERHNIIGKLNSINPQYFGGLDKENTSIGQLNKAYDKYLQNLQSIITARVLEAKLTEQIEARIKFEKENAISGGKLIYANPEYIKAQNDALRKDKEMIEAEKMLAEEIAKLNPESIKGATGVNKLTDSFTGLGKELNLELAYLKRIRDELDKLAKPVLTYGDKENTKFRKQDLKLEEARVMNPEENSLGKYLKGITENLAPAIAAERLFFKEQSEGWKKSNQLAYQFAESMSGDITNSIGNVWSALQKGDNVFKTLSDEVTRFAENLALAIIKAEILASIQGAITTSGFGAAGAAAGGGGFWDLIMSLMGMGGGSSASAFNLGGGGGAGGMSTMYGNLWSGFHAEGGITTKPSLGMIGEAGPEAIMPLDKLKGFLNTSFSAGAMSGQSSGGNGQFVLKGQDLILAINRSNASLNLRRGF